ncbi:hypothetical protein GCM10009117_12380 [Gangjinia marincola]|uniref:Uncharacterized protein n=1 Tax=Gangjinia marincola TaxID=578463 RepID=A0ABN1MFZ9_9FLAO
MKGERFAVANQGDVLANLKLNSKILFHKEPPKMTQRFTKPYYNSKSNSQILYRVNKGYDEHTQENIEH